MISKRAVEEAWIYILADCAGQETQKSLELSHGLAFKDAESEHD